MRMDARIKNRHPSGTGKPERDLHAAGQSRRTLLKIFAGAVLAAISPLPASTTQAKAEAPRKVYDWPNLFGPNHNSMLPADAGTIEPWSKTGPKVDWVLPVGTGYSSPVIVDGKLVMFHRVGDEERVDCLDATTNKQLWSFAYPTKYVDPYGYNNGPRCTPIIAGGVVYTLGAEGKLHAIDFATGKQIWQRDINKDFAVPPGFFGVGASPLLEGDRLVINVGGVDTDAGIAAFDIKTGKTLWHATNQGASYATPVAATIHGKRHVFVFTQAGLVSINPADGKIWFNIPFRSKLYESVNASSPLVIGNTVIVSSSYNTGTLAVEVQPDGSPKERWRSRDLESHFSNMMELDGNILGFSGRHENRCEVCYLDLETGKILWRFDDELGRGSVVRLGNQWILWGERGKLELATITKEGRREHAATEQGLLEWPCWAPPVYWNGRLYLRNDSQLVALALPLAAGK